MAESTLGNPADKVSAPNELMKESKVSGHGAPTHAPQRASQEYIDVDSGRTWNYWAGAWH